MVIHEVDRIVYDNLAETSWRDLAGKNDFADLSLVEPGICAALS